MRYVVLEGMGENKVNPVDAFPSQNINPTVQFVRLALQLGVGWAVDSWTSLVVTGVVDISRRPTITMHEKRRMWALMQHSSRPIPTLRQTSPATAPRQEVRNTPRTWLGL